MVPIYGGSGGWRGEFEEEVADLGGGGCDCGVVMAKVVY
jgi:hypothetical protein